MSTSVTLTASRLKSFNCRTTVKVLIHIKYVKNESEKITWELFEIAKQLAKTFQQTSRHIHLENILSTTDFKRNSSVAFKASCIHIYF